MWPYKSGRVHARQLSRDDLKVPKQKKKSRAVDLKKNTSIFSSIPLSFFL